MDLMPFGEEQVGGLGWRRDQAAETQTAGSSGKHVDRAGEERRPALTVPMMTWFWRTVAHQRAAVELDQFAVAGHDQDADAGGRQRGERFEGDDRRAAAS
jgi:hypothetical protein